MNAVPFDTLNMARKLQTSGLDSGAASGLVEALVEAMQSADLATRADTAAASAAIDGLRIELKSESAGRHIELKTEIAALQIQLKTDNELLRREIVIKFGSMMVIGVGVMLTAIRYLVMHP